MAFWQEHQKCLPCLWLTVYSSCKISCGYTFRERAVIFGACTGRLGVKYKWGIAPSCEEWLVQMKRQISEVGLSREGATLPRLGYQCEVRGKKYWNDSQYLLSNYSVLDPCFSPLCTLVLSFTHILHKVKEVTVTILNEETEAQHCPTGKRWS